MSEIKTEFLFMIALEVEVLSLGNTPYGGRRIFSFNTGSFEGQTRECWLSQTEQKATNANRYQETQNHE